MKDSLYYWLIYLRILGADKICLLLVITEKLIPEMTVIKAENIMKFLLPYMLLIVISCNTPKKSDTDCNEIDQILLINRTENKYLVDSTIIDNRVAINEFCTLFKEKINIESPNVKNNFGFFELIVRQKNEENFGVDVIYTVFDGVIVGSNNGYYKQNKFIDYILRNARYK